ncbi:MAG: hypothetical protein HZA79_16550 [Sphingobacteriales bacterium]|nr:hypothetical protein [Sphingobacteriales bacterium]
MKSPNGFAIKYIFLAYVPPHRDEDQPFTIQTEILKAETKATAYLFSIFDSAADEANVEIIFNSDDKQNNDIRNNLLSITQKKAINHKSTYAKKLAEHLYSVTDERNGTGLLTIIEGRKAGTTRLVLMRFKGDEGLYNHGKKLLVDYIPEVFTKKSNHYKLAYYEDTISAKSFWKGFAIDKQISSSTYKPISFFWVEEFLHSKTALTSAQGTMEFSKIIKTILAKTTDLEEQEEIISGIVNLRTKKGAQISVAQFCKNYLSEKVSDRIREEMKNDDFFNSAFPVDTEIYAKEFGKTVLSLQDGITAYVPSFTYNKHVTETTNYDGSKNIKIEAKLRSKKMNVEKKEKQKAVK